MTFSLILRMLIALVYERHNHEVTMTRTFTVYILFYCSSDIIYFTFTRSIDNGVYTYASQLIMCSGLMRTRCML